MTVNETIKAIKMMPPIKKPQKNPVPGPKQDSNLGHSRMAVSHVDSVTYIDRVWLKHQT